ncbi:MAG: hypothetical protein NTW86_07570 [Candidatus Sumerlaeota bacterium]|nr:hypothetical protein [Candidatus Sumerlaeota bacterium]
MMAMALLAMFFSMVYLGQQTKLAVLCHHALTAARRLFGIPDFRYYAIADGIRALLVGRLTAPPFDFRRHEPQDDAQLDMLEMSGLPAT